MKLRRLKKPLNESLPPNLLSFKKRGQQVICDQVNYHRQRRWLEILVLKGTILFIVLTRTNLCAALRSAYPFSPGVLHIALSVPQSVPLYLRNILSTTGAAPNTASLLSHIFGTVSAIAFPSDIP